VALRRQRLDGKTESPAIAAKVSPVDSVAGVAKGIGDERIAKVLVEDDKLAVAMDLLAAVNREDSLHEGRGVMGIDGRYSRNAKEMSCAAVSLVAVRIVSWATSS
jgi:hypothetical protein